VHDARGGLVRDPSGPIRSAASAFLQPVCS
jgi:hypothetical protein